MSGNIELVPYHPVFLPDLYDICLKTANAGRTAEALYHDPAMPGHVYLGPYLEFEPDLTIVAVTGGRAVGYIVGTSDSQAFLEKFARTWLPILLERYANIPDGFASSTWLAGHIRKLAGGGSYTAAKAWHSAYPAELHIDILPAGQGKGLGRKLIDAFLENLKGRAAGVHLGYDTRNTGAGAFYSRLGFETLETAPGVIWMGKKTGA